MPGIAGCWNEWNECVNIVTRRLGFIKKNAYKSDKWMSLTIRNFPTLPQCGHDGVVFYGLGSQDVY